MYSFPNLEAVSSISGPNCCFLTCIQISQEAGKVVWYFSLLKNILQLVVIHTVKGFQVINKAKVDFFFPGTLLLFSMIQCILAVWSLVPLPFQRLNIWKFSVHILLKTCLENFEHYLDKSVNECNCIVVWKFFGISFLWDWNENTFSSPMATAEFSKFAGILSATLSQHHFLGFEIVQLEFHHLH